MANVASYPQLMRIAVRNVRGNRRRALLAGVAILLGVLAVMTMRGMLNGVQTALRSEAIHSQMGALQIHRAGYMAQVFGTPLDLDMAYDDALLHKLEQVDNVKAVAPRIGFGAMVSTGDNTTFAMITAFDPQRDIKVCPLRHERLTAGALPGAKHPDGLVLSAELARRIGSKIQAGDVGRVAVLTNDHDGSLNAVDTRLMGLNGLPRSPGLETRLGLMGLAHAQELLRMEGRATEIAVAVHDLTKLEETRAALLKTLGKEFEVSTWPELARPVADATAIQDQVLKLVTAILLVVALVGVINTMLMSVLERTREIGVMMALGMRREAIVLLQKQKRLWCITERPKLPEALHQLIDINIVPLAFGHFVQQRRQGLRAGRIGACAQGQKTDTVGTRNDGAVAGRRAGKMHGNGLDSMTAKVAPTSKHHLKLVNEMEMHRQRIALAQFNHEGLRLAQRFILHRHENGRRMIARHGRGPRTKIRAARGAHAIGSHTPDFVGLGSFEISSKKHGNVPLYRQLLACISH